MPSPPKSPSIGIRYISDAVKSDHRLIEKLHASLVSPKPPTTPDHQRAALCSQLSWEVARHLVAMELFIFPGTAHRAKQGSEAARERQRDMAELRGTLLSFSQQAATARKAGSDDENLGAALGELGALLGRHIRDVERVDLVNIENMLSAQESEDLAKDFERSVFFIPHGVREEDEEEDVGVEAPYKSVEGLLGASAGELRDAMEKFPRE